MQTRLHRVILISALLLTGIAPSQSARAADETYPIKINRPAKAGDVYETHIFLELKDSATATVQGVAQPPRSSAAKGDLVARINVAEVDKTRNEKTFSITIPKFTGRPD